MKREELKRTLTIAEAIKLGFQIRCGFSRKGLETFVNNHGWKNRTGFLVGESRDRQCWRVRWDGVNYSNTYHKSFIIPIFDK